MIPLAEIVDVHSLVQTALAALIAGAGIMLAFSLAIFGFTRSVDLRRSGRDVAAFGVGVFGALALAVSVAAVVLGLVVVAS